MVTDLASNVASKSARRNETCNQKPELFSQKNREVNAHVWFVGGIVNAWRCVCVYLEMQNLSLAHGGVCSVESNRFWLQQIDRETIYTMVVSMS